MTECFHLVLIAGYVGRTFVKAREPEEGSDPFTVPMTTTSGMQKEVVGINPNSRYYKLSKWCYDTPGTVQPDQVYSWQIVSVVYILMENIQTSIYSLYFSFTDH